ncbi:hypothetical protein [Thiorhodovibrio frisius]|uniref:Uncharacterized protein n=1 Tax=Thiorhodovibrio frisius TaxID=631362 RepID=H8Z8N4_9GAMM|nr:hypothetical protein [Thiorhodovibrio frisius]EIC19439.1 hypothetical protein Thi970DRAFT_04961 [Thiorhodovibrio frisius]WPL22258.1 hypothetical protein Thiofri_02418 [Thiorhodovibrio frisius]
MALPIISVYSVQHTLQVGSELLLIAYLFLTGLSFIASFAIQKAEVTTTALDIVRLQLRLYFWISLITWLVLTLLSIGSYTDAYLVTLPFEDSLSSIYKALGLLRRSDPEPAYFLNFISVFVIFIFIPMPFMMSNKRLNRSFKKAALLMSQKDLMPGTSMTIKSFEPDKLLPAELAQKMVRSSSEAMVWVDRVYDKNEYARYAKIWAASQELYEYRNEHIDLEWSETNVKIDISRRNKDAIEATVYEELLFDGLCMRLPKVFNQEMPTVLKEVCLSKRDAGGETLREPRRYNPIFKWLKKSRDMNGNLVFEFSPPAFSSGGGDKPEVFVGELERAPELASVDPYLQYFGVLGQDLFLFFHTGLSGNLLEFNLRESAAENLVAFKKDLRLIMARLKAVEPLLDRLASEVMLASR